MRTAIARRAGGALTCTGTGRGRSDVVARELSPTPRGAPDESSSRHRLHPAPGDPGPADPRARARTGPGPHRGLRPVPHRHPRRPRRLAGQAHPAVHPRPRGRRHRREGRARGHRPRGRRPGRHRRGSATRAAAAATASAAGRRCASQQQNSGYSIDGAFAEYAVADADYVVAVPDGVTLARRGAADLRRRDDVQGDQGRAHRAHREGRDLRHRRPRPPRRAVRAAGRRHRHRGRRRGREARAGPRARRGPHRERPHDRPGRGASRSSAASTSPSSWP